MKNIAINKKNIRIGNRLIGENEPVFIVAEIGSNHDRDLNQAEKLIEAAAKIGADAVKFQSFSAEELLSRKKLSGKENWIPDTSFEILKKLELPNEWHKKLFERANELGITFFSTPFNEQKADLLNSIGIQVFKVASGDLTHIPFLRHLAKLKKPIILSTGAAYLEEINKALKVIYDEGNDQVALLHCVSLYPPKFEDTNIKAMITLKNKFNTIVGYSDHSPGWTIALGAVSLGAKIIEKHITLDRNFKGPDHKYALTVEEFGSMIKEIRNLEEALGNGVKRPSPDEMEERIGARRSLYAARKIIKGEVIEKEMIKIVRHAYGINPEGVEKIIGKKAKVDIESDELITWNKI